MEGKHSTEKNIFCKHDIHHKEVSRFKPVQDLNTESAGAGIRGKTVAVCRYVSGV